MEPTTEENNKPGLKQFAHGRADQHKIDPRDITVEPGFNSRDFTAAENIDHINDLKASILERGGIKTPLTVRFDAETDKVVLVDGECRLRAVLELIDDGHDIKTVPCQGEDSRKTNAAERLADQVTRNSGKQFAPLELAHLCRRLSGFGWTPAEIAKKLSKSQSYISYLFSLLAMPEEVQQHVKAGEIAASAAATILREEGEVNGVSAIAAAVEEHRQEADREEERIAQEAAELAASDPSLPMADTSGEPAPVEEPAPKAKKAKTKRVSVGKVKAKAAELKGKKLGPKFTIGDIQKVSDFFVYVGRSRSLDAVKEEADRVYKELFAKA